MKRSVPVALGLLAMSAVAVAGQESVVVRVHVVQAATDEHLVAALVEVEGHGQRITSEEGVATFPRVSPGVYQVRVSAMGYGSRETSAVLASDTTIVVSLDLAPLPLDSLNVLVEKRTATLRGRVTGADTRRGVPGAEIIVGGLDVRSGPGGGYRVSVPSGVPLWVEVRSPGYLPWSTEVRMAGDDRLEIELAVDPVGQRMIERQHERLERRVRRSPHPTQTLKREDLLRHVGPIDALPGIRRLLGVTECVVVDDRVMDWGILGSLLPEELERIEYIRRTRSRDAPLSGSEWTLSDTSMVRIYTYDYVRRELADGRTLRPLLPGACW